MGYFGAEFWCRFKHVDNAVVNISGVVARDRDSHVTACQCVFEEQFGLVPASDIQYKVESKQNHNKDSIMRRCVGSACYW